MKKKPIKFGTKAETLERLRSVAKNFIVEDVFKFIVNDWIKSRDEVIKLIKNKFNGSEVIIRSSAKTEDLKENSKAGCFTTISSVSLSNRKRLIDSVNRVVASYNDKKRNHQILIQKYLSNLELSGVVFTKDINTSAPYIIINYDDGTNRSDLITAGKASQSKTQVVFKGKESLIKDSRIKKIYRVILEIEKIFNSDSLDIEFGYKDGKVHIFQVRRIATSIPKSKVSRREMSLNLSKACRKLRRINVKKVDLYGNKTMFSVMSDWNPAEMIGVKPRPLALSLYRELITDSIWAKQREDYGYKKVSRHPLIISIAGLPYIDVRVDFNSFIPKSLSKNLSQKLINYYLNKLKQIPDIHDKVEFEIVYSCYVFNTEKRLKELAYNNFSKEEVSKIRSSILELTNYILSKDGPYQRDLKRIEKLESIRKKIIDLNLSKSEKIYQLVKSCKKYGTRSFAGLARAAFISVEFLNSMVDLNIISEKEKDKFFRSLNTITKQFNQDVKALFRKKIKTSDFLEKYGHLRPGTYDILSDNYKEGYNNYLNLKNKNSFKIKDKSRFNLSSNQLEKIKNLLNKHKLKIHVNRLIFFLRESIEARERAKFIFTKNINDILDTVENIGKSLKISKNDMSFAEIKMFLKNKSKPLNNFSYFIKKEIVKNKKIYNKQKVLNLPSLISEPNEIYCFQEDKGKASFITTKKVMADTVFISNKSMNPSEIRNKIVFLKSADPGFDWLFSCNIKGFITMYGGTGSHMAIRSAELDIPAVIGCGRINFENWSKASRIEIDCLNSQVKAIF